MSAAGMSGSADRRRARSSDRFVVEATWSGYTSEQANRIRHRTVEPRYFAERVNGAVHRFSDGTCLYVTSRPCKPRERVQELDSYGAVIRDLHSARYKAEKESAAKVQS